MYVVANEENDTGKTGLVPSWFSEAITHDFTKSRKVMENGRVTNNEAIVCESLRLRILKNSEEAGNPAASKRFLRWMYTLGSTDRVDGTTKASERRMETEKGSARNEHVEVKWR